MWATMAAAEEEGDKGDKGARESSRLQDAVFHELMQECRHSAPGARLSARLRTALERMCPETRRAVVSRTRDGCAPLFVACKRDNLEIVEYLVHVCGADVEQRGVYEVAEERSVHHVTPLWCAAVAGRLRVLRALADAGADLDAGSDSGSTPVRSACFMTHVEVVRFLAERGADIHRPNYNGGTCLINSVQSARLCAYLLERGARVDAADMQRKTALHYAIQEHRVETARLLLEHGADPHARSRAGDDALQTACLKGAAQAVSLLARAVRYPPERLADAYELLGATKLDEFNDVGGALAQWRRALALRAAHGLTKRRPAPHAALRFAREFADAAELEAAATDADALRTQALLVCERVLGPHHKDTVFRLMYRGAAYVDAHRHRRCVDLWTWALRLRLERESLLYADACHTACALTRLMLDTRAGEGETPRYEDALAVFELVAEQVPEARRALQVRPVFKKQAETFDRALRCLTHLLHLLLAALRDRPHPERALHLQRRLRWLVAQDVRSAHTGDTLLHLCVSRLNVIRSTYFSDDVGTPCTFPCVWCARALLAAGAAVSARNEARSTPLHVAAIPYNFSTELVETLLAGGAHLDQPNRFGDTPAALVAANTESRVCPLRHTSLACLAATAAVRHAVPVPPPHALPATLRRFLRLHTP